MADLREVIEGEENVDLDDTFNPGHLAKGILGSKAAKGESRLCMRGGRSMRS